jgi:hypothetical protein
LVVSLIDLQMQPASLMVALLARKILPLAWPMARGFINQLTHKPVGLLVNCSREGACGYPREKLLLPMIYLCESKPVKVKGELFAGGMVDAAAKHTFSCLEIF